MYNFKPSFETGYFARPENRARLEKLQSFLEAMFGNCAGSRGSMGLWLLVGDRKLSYWLDMNVPDFNHWAKEIIDLATDSEIYFHVALHMKEKVRGYTDDRPTTFGRGRINTAIFITSMWVELDFKNGAESHFRSVLKKIPLPPSIIVKSGGGLHVYWLLKSPEPVTEKMQNILKDWQRLIRHKSDVKVDFTHDVSHVFRLPSTLNNKYQRPRPVELDFINADRRYSLNEFEKILIEGLPPSPQKIKNKRQWKSYIDKAGIYSPISKQGKISAEPGVLTDQQILALAKIRFPNKFPFLYQGRWESLGYDSQSEADLALCGYLSRITRDQKLIDRIMRSSGLFREKWDRITSDGISYGDATIHTALSSLKGLYNVRGN